LPTLETLLRMNKAALVRTESGYQILPEVKAVRGRVTPQLGDNRQPLPAGYRVQIVPLRYIGAKEMEKILQPLAPEGAVIRVDTARNLLVLAGAGTELQHLLETVEIFDVDWLAGMSVGLFTLRTVEAKTVIDELETVFGDKTEGPLAGLVRIIPIERLNALLVVTPQPKYLEDARRWIERLDTGIDITSARLYVYRVQNGRAVYLAELLNELFTGQGEQRNRAVPEATLAPGRRPAEVKSTASARKGQQQSQRPSSQARREAVRGGDALLEGEAVRIIADEENNALLILASPAEYQQIEAALRRLDVIPLQVLVEVSIIEVLLDDELEYGIQWFFNHHIGYKGKKVGALLWDGSDLTDEGGFGIHPGFNWSIVDKADKIIGILNMLAEESKVNILSSPSVLVLDNQTATIDVGDQVPILTSTTRASASDLGTTTSTIEYRDTGVRLTVTPRVNAGGLVTMEVEQEVSDVEQTTTSGIDSPTIQQRRISSTVAVQSRQTVVLGGLIRENKGKSKSGIPVLHTLPAVGPLFGQTSYTTRRTELVIVLTPQVVRNPEDARKVTRELREKLKGLPPLPPDTYEHVRTQQTS
jgi:general secretion pathway protein D